METKTIQKFPVLFAPLAMINKEKDLSLKTTISSVEGEISRRKRILRVEKLSTEPQARNAAMNPQNGIIQQKGPPKNGKEKKMVGTRFLCNVVGLYDDKCWFRYETGPKAISV